MLKPLQKYHPNDLKGKGEPSFTVEKALKDHKHNTHRRIMSDGDSGYELQVRSRPIDPRQRSASGSGADVANAGTSSSSAAKTAGNYADFESGMRRSNSHKIGEGLKKRFGSIRRKKVPES